MADESSKTSPKDVPKRDPAKRTNAPKALGFALGHLTRPMTKSRGAALGEIIQRWAEIAGPLLKSEKKRNNAAAASTSIHP